MKHWLIAADLWQWTEEENRDAPTAEIPDLANHGSNQLLRATALAALKEDMRSWKRGNELACNAIVSRLGGNYYYDLEKETNAHKLWNGIARECRPEDSVLLNGLYRRLTTLKVGPCKDEADYTRQLRSIHNQILDIHPVLGLGNNYLTFLFYDGLSKGDQVHLPVDGDRIPWGRHAAVWDSLHFGIDHGLREQDELVD